jgi:hypothetical protein
MGGMFTILKVRDSLPADGSDPVWVTNPPEKMACLAAEGDIKRDGIDPQIDTGTGHQFKGRWDGKGKVRWT